VSTNGWTNSAQCDRVHQASGMISVQAKCTPADGLVWMRERAEETGTTLDAIAEAVLDRRLRFSP